MMSRASRRLLYLKWNDWTWWAWAVTDLLLFVGLAGYSPAFLGAMLITAGQGAVLLGRDRSVRAFSVQLRAAYLLLLIVCYLPGVRWLYWLPALGTLALVVFGYCLLARLLSLLPWNSREPYTLDRLRRTFLSAPDLGRVSSHSAAAGCAGGLCTLEAQIAPRGERSGSSVCGRE
ncbi:MAG: hypothetical protein WD534_11395 [Phycisphaeraceae bacterium]